MITIQLPELPQLTLQTGLNSLVFQQYEQFQVFDQVLTTSMTKPSKQTYLQDQNETFDRKHYNYLKLQMSAKLRDKQKDELVLTKLLSDLTTSHEHIMQYQQFQMHQLHFLNTLAIRANQLNVRFYADEFNEKQLFKMLSYDVFDQEEQEMMSVCELYQTTLELWLANKTDQTRILYLSYPENDIGTAELEQLLTFLDTLNIIVIIVTNNLMVLNHMKTVSQTTFVLNHWRTYNIADLQREYQLFHPEGTVQQVLLLAYADMMHVTNMLTVQDQEFIASTGLNWQNMI